MSVILVNMDSGGMERIQSRMMTKNFQCFIALSRTQRQCIIAPIYSSLQRCISRCPNQPTLCPTGVSPYSGIDIVSSILTDQPTINGIQKFFPPTFKLDKPLSVTEEILITLICDALLIFLGDNRFVGLCNYLPFWFPLSKLQGKGYIMFEENMYVLCYCN